MYLTFADHIGASPLQQAKLSNIERETWNGLRQIQGLDELLKQNWLSWQTHCSNWNTPITADVVDELPEELTLCPFCTSQMPWKLTSSCLVSCHEATRRDAIDSSRVSTHLHVHIATITSIYYMSATSRGKGSK